MMKCAEHSSFPAGFQYIAILLSVYYFLTLLKILMLSIMLLAVSHLHSNCLPHRRHPRSGAPDQRQELKTALEAS